MKDNRAQKSPKQLLMDHFGPLTTVLVLDVTDPYAARSDGKFAVEILQPLRTRRLDQVTNDLQPLDIGDGPVEDGEISVVALRTGGGTGVLRVVATMDFWRKDAFEFAQWVTRRQIDRFTLWMGSDTALTPDGTTTVEWNRFLDMTHSAVMGMVKKAGVPPNREKVVTVNLTVAQNSDGSLRYPPMGLKGVDVILYRPADAEGFLPELGNPSEPHSDRLSHIRAGKPGIAKA